MTEIKLPISPVEFRAIEIALQSYNLPDVTPAEFLKEWLMFQMSGAETPQERLASMAIEQVSNLLSQTFETARAELGDGG